MEEYQKQIYYSWGKKNPENFPYPDEDFIKKKLRFYFEIINRFFPKNKKIWILELGSGYGLFLKACKLAGYQNLLGLEIIDECIAFAKEKLGIELKKAEILEYLEREPKAKFDIVCAFDVIEHFKKEEVIALFHEIYRILSKNGYFIMRVPNAGSPQGLYMFFSDLTHQIGFTDALARELLEMAGFQRILILPDFKSLRKRVLLELIRKPLSLLFPFLKNKFLFSTNLYAIGYKSKI